ncbi:5'-nucleotidase domain-containing protein [Melioribacter roseus P3M-2]|uniref:5'-nucleotidase domain-containing protein n=1 Tax=Melioribacter roseus (strain DSM 23840 / JCM 17771 / VKM B-2668 / P3M-2) TaxID=1191523 RepID=I6ZXJ2_MELRP|nr:T9SS type A sorting domain-containing protein [Melioribacter roseus]AFN73778.1 5'-nucleotidase domain-containing protein [Melioribacter roseus P3M-2]
MKKLLFLVVFVFLFPALLKGQVLRVESIEKIAEFYDINDMVVGFYDVTMSGDYIFGTDYQSIYRSNVKNLNQWEKISLPILRIGDFITTANGCVVIASGRGTYLTPDSGKTWIMNEKHGPFAMLPLSDGSFLAGGGWYDLLRVRTDISPNITDEKLWEQIVDSSRYWGQNTISFLYRTSTGRIIAYLMGLNRQKEGVWVSDDEGKNWRRPTPNLPEIDLDYLFRSVAENKYNLLAVSDLQLYISSDGESWGHYQNPATDHLLFSSVIYSPSLGWLLGGEKLLWSWDLQNWTDLNFNYGVYSMIEINGEYLLSTGDGIYLLKADVQTDVPILSSPTDFSLSQNYPNPFNPTTKIKYSVPKKSFVNITVYDILGREIITLVNEEKTPGNYEVEFDGGNLSNGIYLYRMQSGEFSEIKKLILLK